MNRNNLSRVGIKIRLNDVNCTPIVITYTFSKKKLFTVK